MPSIRLKAPPGVDRWEPSGAVVRGARLWVANDRDGWIAAYALPLTPGPNRPGSAHALDLGLDFTKLEDVAPAPGGGLLLLEAMTRTVWRCDRPAEGCPDLRAVPVDAARDALVAALPEPAEYVTFEGLAATEARTWIGMRGYLPAGQAADAYRPRGGVADDTGAGPAALEGWTLDGRTYGLSGLAADGDTLWMTWSSEIHAGGGREEVRGLLARASLRDPARRRLCARFDGKAEAVAVWGDQLIVVFDNDRARKRRGDDRAFDLDADEDYARVLPAATCPPVAGSDRPGEVKLAP